MKRVLINIIRRWQSFSHEKRYVILNLGGTFILVIVQYVLAFALNFSLGRILGAYEYGIYSTALHWMLLLGINIGNSSRSLMIRHGSLLLTRREFDKWNCVFGKLWQYTLISALTITLVLLITFYFATFIFPDKALRTAVLIAVASSPFYIMTQVHGSALLAYKKAALAFFVQRSILTFTLLILVLLGMVLLGNQLTSGIAVTWLVSLAAIISFLFSVLLYTYFLGLPTVFSAHKNVRLPFDAGTYLFFLFLQISGGMLYNIAPLLSGFLFSPDLTGTFNMAYRFLGPVQVPAMLIGSVVSPLIPQLYFSGQKERLQNMINKLILVMLIVSSMVGLAFIMSDKLILSFLKDPVYETHGFSLALKLLVLGGLIVISSGPTGLILSLLHREKLHMISVLTGIVTIGMGTFIFGNLIGAPGISLAYTIGITVYNCLNLFFMAKTLKLFIGPAYLLKALVNGA